MKPGDMHQDDPCDEIMGPGGRPPDDASGPNMLGIVIIYTVVVCIVGAALIIIF